MEISWLDQPRESSDLPLSASPLFCFATTSIQVLRYLQTALRFRKEILSFCLVRPLMKTLQISLPLFSPPFPFLSFLSAQILFFPERSEKKKKKEEEEGIIVRTAVIIGVNANASFARAEEKASLRL